MTIPHTIYSYSYTIGSSDVHINNSIPLAVVSSHSETSQITTGILIQSNLCTHLTHFTFRIITHIRVNCS